MAPERVGREPFQIPSLDGIRAASVLLVFLGHSALHPYGAHFAVTVFFFLSGFLITTLLRMESERTGKISIRSFYLRRALRILPPMYLVLAIAVVLTLVGILPGAVRADTVVLQVFHLTNYYVLQAGWREGMAPGTWIYWSLAVEEHFYLAFPVIYLGLRRLSASARVHAAAFVAICGVVLAWRFILVLLLNAPEERTYIATDTRIDSILFGCILAIIANPVLDRTRIPEWRWKWVWFPLGVGLLLVTFLIRDPSFLQTVRYTLQGVALFPLFIIAVRYPAWGPIRLLNLRVVKLIGVMSYAMYLVHPTVIFGIEQATNWPPIAQGLTALGITLVIAAVIHRFVERPCANLRARLSRIGAPTVPTEAWIRDGRPAAHNAPARVPAQIAVRAPSREAS